METAVGDVFQSVLHSVIHRFCEQFETQVTRRWMCRIRPPKRGAGGWGPHEA